MVRDISDATAKVEALKLGQPGAYRLARVLSLAAQVEFALLRRARLLFPDVDASAEADLCASDVVSSRTPQGLVLDADAAEILRRALAGDQQLLDRAWNLVSVAHRQAPWPTRAEEHINRLSLSTDPAAAERIQQILIATAREMVESTDRVDAARWMMRALMRLPPSAGESEAGRAIHAGVAVNLDGRVDLADAKLPSDAFDTWFPWLIGGAGRSASLAVALLDGFLELGGSNASGTIAIPETTPLIIDVSWHDGLAAHSERVTLEAGERRQVRVTAQEIELRGLDGSRYRLRPHREGAIGRGGIDFSAVRARHRPFVGRDSEIAAIDDLMTVKVPSSPGHSPAPRLAITGAPGIGKTALLCRYLDLLEERGGRVLTHFFEGGPLEWQRPETLEASLLAQMADWPSRSSGSGERVVFDSELVHRAAEGEPVIVLLDGFNTNPFTGFRADFVNKLPLGVRALWTQNKADDDPTSSRGLLDLDERRQSNDEVCRQYLRMHGAAFDRVSTSRPVESKVFLINSRSDQQHANDVGAVLGQAGFETLYSTHSDANIPPGESWELWLKQSIKRATAVVFLVTRAAIDNESVLEDMAQAIDAGKPIIPITFDRTTQHPALQRLHDVQFLVADPQSDEWKQRLVNAVKQASITGETVESILLRRTEGNIGRLVAMTEWVSAQPNTTVNLDRMPPVLYGAFDRVWAELMSEDDASSVELVAGALAAAREPLSEEALAGLPEIGGQTALIVDRLESAGLAIVTSVVPATSFPSGGMRSTFEARPLEADPGTRMIALSHELVREALVAQFGSGGMRQHNSRLVDSRSLDPRYLQRHAVSHLIDAGRTDEALVRISDAAFLTRVCGELGVDELEALLADAVERIKRAVPEAPNAAA